MKAHIARNQNAGVPLALGWNLSAGDRGKLDGMAPAFGMKVLPVSPADAGKTVAQLLGEVETKSARTLVLEDSYNGVRAGAAGGFVTVMVPDLLPADDEMRSLYTMECTSLNEVLAKLKTGEL